MAEGLGFLVFPRPQTLNPGYAGIHLNPKAPTQGKVRLLGLICEGSRNDFATNQRRCPIQQAFAHSEPVVALRKSLRKTLKDLRKVQRTLQGTLNPKSPKP